MNTGNTWTLFPLTLQDGIAGVFPIRTYFKLHIPCLLNIQNIRTSAVPFKKWAEWKIQVNLIVFNSFFHKTHNGFDFIKYIPSLGNFPNNVSISLMHIIISIYFSLMSRMSVAVLILAGFASHLPVSWGWCRLGLPGQVDFKLWVWLVQIFRSAPSVSFLGVGWSDAACTTWPLSYAKFSDCQA